MDNLKDTGIVRRLDELGRVVLPIEVRRSINMDAKDAFSVFVDTENKAIVLKPVEAKCTLCGAIENLKNHGTGYICNDCVKSIKNL